MTRSLSKPTAAMCAALVALTVIAFGGDQATWTTLDPNADLVFADGQFVQYPSGADRP
jgi:hypothetical protein